MPNLIVVTRRAFAALFVSVSLVGAQQGTPPLQGARVAGELAAGGAGLMLGASATMFVAAGINYLASGHQDLTNPTGIRVFKVALMAGGALGASTSAWLVSRADHQSSNWAANAAVTTAVTALAFKYAGWPYEGGKHRPMSRWRSAAPVWMSAIAATVVASATRERR